MEPHEVRPTLLAACPELAKPFADADADGYADLVYLQMAAVVRFLGEQLRRGRTACFDRLFAAVERCLQEGSASTVPLVIVGLLEGLQNSGVTGIEDLDRWRPFLGPASARAWDSLIDLWEGDVTAINRFEPRLDDELPP